MKKQLRSLGFLLGMGLLTFCMVPLPVAAQQVNQDQRAYDTGYQNGVNDARRNKPMNLSTDDWHGDRVNEYQRGYREGYKSAAGYHEGGRVAAGPYASDPERQRAFETGYQNGMHDRERNREMNPKTDDWHGDRLEAYRQGYEEGYRGDHH